MSKKTARAVKSSSSPLPKTLRKRLGRLPFVPPWPPSSVPTEKQIRFARQLADRYGMHIPDEKILDKAFSKRFLRLFRYDHENISFTGYRRVDAIIDYLKNDKEKEHIAKEMGLSLEEVTFMAEVIAEHKFGGVIPRDDVNDPDPDQTAYEQMEKEYYGETEDDE